MEKRQNLRSWALALVALWMPITFLVTVLVTNYFKQANPDNVDITAGLAYLRHGLTTAIVTAVVLLAITTWLIVALYRADRNFSRAKLPLVLMVTSIGIMGLVMVANSYQNSLEDQYRQTHSQQPN